MTQALSTSHMLDSLHNSLHVQLLNEQCSFVTAIQNEAALYILAAKHTAHIATNMMALMVLQLCCSGSAVSFSDIFDARTTCIRR